MASIYTFKMVSGIWILFDSKMKLKKIFFILPSLGAGGAERVLSYVARHLDRTVFDVKLIVIGFENDSVYSTQNLDVIYLKKKRFYMSIGKLFRLFLTQKPAVVVSSISHVNIIMGILSIFFYKIKFIGRESSVITNMSEYSSFNSARLKKLIKFSYPKLDAIICQSEDMKMDLIRNYNVNPLKLFVIHNPITEIKQVERNVKFGDVVQFITVGRLITVKGHVRILACLASIKNYDFHYKIVGAGREESVIRNKILELGLENKVSFLNYTSKVLSELSKCDYFLQGSYVEGFPNALLESCSVGTPVIAFRCPGGTKDIVENGINGFLVDDEKHFTALLNDYEALKVIDNDQVVASVMCKFDPNKIMNSYQQLLADI